MLVLIDPTKKFDIISWSFVIFFFNIACLEYAYIHFIKISVFCVWGTLVVEARFGLSCGVVKAWMVDFLLGFYDGTNNLSSVCSDKSRLPRKCFSLLQFWNLFGMLIKHALTLFSFCKFINGILIIRQYGLENSWIHLWLIFLFITKKSFTILDSQLLVQYVAWKQIW